LNSGHCLFGSPSFAFSFSVSTEKEKAKIKLRSMEIKKIRKKYFPAKDVLLEEQFLFLLYSNAT